MRTILILLPLALACAGCGAKEEAKTGKEAAGRDEHAHAAKHGGTLLELGAHEGFLEVKVDHEKGVVTVWGYLGEEMTDTKLGAAPVLNLMAGDKPMQLDGKAGADGSWVFTDDALKGEPEGARFRVVLGGKTYSPALEHAHEHDKAEAGEDDGEDEDADDGDGGAEDEDADNGDGGGDDAMDEDAGEDAEDDSGDD